jgi:pyruvate/2-oxoglutarate dehydrogenase complex dihydrolipoamide dehydrogenase (E3) component
METAVGAAVETGELARRGARTVLGLNQRVWRMTEPARRPLEALGVTDLVQRPVRAIADRVETQVDTLQAAGRSPNGKKIGADKAGVTVSDRGFIPVDRQMRTNVEHIFAIGDIVGQPMLAHKATHEGKVAAEVASGEKSAFDARVVPSVAYTDPEVAWVGLTETDAKAQGVTFEKAVFPWSASGR